MKCSTSKASFVAACAFSSSDTRPRQKSDESTSVGLKCVRAKLDFPQPEGPIRTTSESSGIVMFTEFALSRRLRFSAEPLAEGHSTQLWPFGTRGASSDSFHFPTVSEEDRIRFRRRKLRLVRESGVL